MKYYPITLGVRRLNWSAKNDASRNKKIDRFEANEKVFARDDHTCQCCGFRAEKYQQVLHLNGDDFDFRDDNVLTTCVFCHQCFDLSIVEKMDSGKLIWLPELSQADLHHLMRALYIARVSQGGLSEMARKLYAVLLDRGEEARKRLGSTDPGALALVMRDFLMQKQYEKLQEQLDGIRLLPLDRRMVYAVKNPDGTETILPLDKAKIKPNEETYNQFPQILANWRKEKDLFGDLPSQDWPSLFKEFLDTTRVGAESPSEKPVALLTP